MGTPATARTDEKRRGARVRRERELAALARTQHGVLTRDQLLAAGLSLRTIRRRLEAGRLTRLHREVFAIGQGDVSLRGRWIAAVFACGEGALLSHRSAAALWGLMKARPGPIEVTATAGRGRSEILLHEGGIHEADRSLVTRIPVTSVARTLFDLSEVVTIAALERACEEADRLGLLKMKQLEDVCARGHGRRGQRPIRRLIEQAREPIWTLSELEHRFARFCRERGFPPYQANVEVLGHEVDAFWPRERVIAELDGFAFHSHREAFERDRTRDIQRQVGGYKAIRVTDRRLRREADALAAEIRGLLKSPG